MSKETLFDRRTAARNVGSSRINRKDLEQHLASLPDVGSKSVPIFSSAHIADADDFDDEDLDDEAEDDS